LGAGTVELEPGDPRQVGPYGVLGRLGSGGMGRVFLARSPGGRYVAVKVIRAEFAEQADFRIRFAREVATAQRVSGLFTAPVVDADVDAPVPWLATAYVSGPSLGDAVARNGPLPVASVLALAAGLAEGLGAIHAAGIVHRDLKPSNVLLAEDGPRVIDFGISRAAEQFALTGTGLVVGSPGFMSPEQAQGHAVGPPSDVFSLGAVLSFAATGEGPFGSGSTAALLYRVVFAPPATEALPARLRPLIERCLAKDPQQRPSTGDLLSDLNAQPTAGWLPAAITHGWQTHPPTVAVMANAPSARPVPDSPKSVGSRGGRGRFSRKVIIAILAVAALALSGMAAALALTRTSSPTEVTLQSVRTPGANPFMPAVGTDQQPGSRPLKGAGGTFPGGTPGLYGGTMKKASCNPQQLVSFLRAHPDKAAAWAGVLGIRPADIPSYVAGLTSVVLRSDTAVTNHGYTDGHVTSLPAVLQAGTAVLINQYGQPVTKCFCGNPLTKPMAYAQPTYVGKRWASFSSTSVTIIEQSTVVIVSFTVVDSTTDTTFRVHSGTSIHGGWPTPPRVAPVQGGNGSSPTGVRTTGSGPPVGSTPCSSSSPTGVRTTSSSPPVSSPPCTSPTPTGVSTTSSSGSTPCSSPTPTNVSTTSSSGSPTDSSTPCSSPSPTGVRTTSSSPPVGSPPCTSPTPTSVSTTGSSPPVSSPPCTSPTPTGVSTTGSSSPSPTGVSTTGSSSPSPTGVGTTGSSGSPTNSSPTPTDVGTTGSSGSPS